MSADAVILEGRRWAESLMLDQCVIRRVVGPPGPLDPDTGERSPAPTEVIYGSDDNPAEDAVGGRCKVQTYEPHEGKPESGQHIFTVQRYSVHIPVGEPQIAVDDRIEITAAVRDASLVGRTYRVSGLLHKSFATAQRMLVDEVVA